jgi:hypothetical protein
MELPSNDRGKLTRQISLAMHDDEPVCRFFLCALCRRQTIVCPPCDRGQIYCSGTCAQQARRDRQREARRRHQATPRGRAMHAVRNRRYRARKRCVTDQGPVNESKNRSLPELRAINDPSGPLSSEKFIELRFCYHCGRAASKFLKLDAHSPGYHRCN